MNNTLLIGVAALLAGGAGGFIVGKSGSDPAEAEKQAGNLPPAKIRRDARDLETPDRAVRADSRTVGEVMREPGQTARLQALIDLYAGMDAAQLEEEAANLDGLPMSDRILASVLLFSRWAELDPQGALAYSNTMGMAGMFAKPTILRSWASVDPVNAAKYFTENPNEFAGMGRGRGPGGDAGAALIAREWAKLDPDAALAWANGLDERNRGDAVVSVVSEIAMTDPSKAAAMAATLEGGDASRAYGEIAEQWAKKDFSAAEAWIQTLSGEARDSAMAAAIGSLADQDPQAAAGRIASMGEGESRDRAIRDVASAWSRENPAEAAAWLVSQQASDSDDAMRRVMGNWVTQDSAGALAFIESQPVGEIRDGATQTYLWMNRDAAPSQSIALAESISDEGDRARAIGMTARRWMEEDEAAARAYIESSTVLDDQMKERILSDDGGDRRFGGRGR